MINGVKDSETKFGQRIGFCSEDGRPVICLCEIGSIDHFLEKQTARRQSPGILHIHSYNQCHQHISSFFKCTLMRVEINFLTRMPCYHCFSANPFVSVVFVFRLDPSFPHLNSNSKMLFHVFEIQPILQYTKTHRRIHHSQCCSCK